MFTLILKYGNEELVDETEFMSLAEAQRAAEFDEEFLESIGIPTDGREIRFNGAI